MSGDTCWRGHIVSLRSGPTIKIWSTSALQRNLIGGKPDGLCSCLDLIMHFTIVLVVVWESQMHFPEGLTKGHVRARSALTFGAFGLRTFPKTWTWRIVE